MGDCAVRLLSDEEHEVSEFFSAGGSDGASGTTRNEQCSQYRSDGSFRNRVHAHGSADGATLMTTDLEVGVRLFSA